MKLRHTTLAVFLVLTWTGFCLGAKYTTTYNRWPYAAPKTMVTDGGTRLFVAKGDVVREYDLSNTPPTWVQDAHVETSGGITSMVYQAPYLLVTKGYKGVERIDTNNMGATPNALVIYGTDWDNPDRTTDDAALTRGVTVSGGKAYVAYTKIIPNSSMVSGLETVDVSGGGNISPLGAGDLNLNTIYEDINTLYLSEARGVVHKDDYAFVADFVNSLVVYDITADEPVYQNLWGAISSLDIYHPGGNYVFVAGSSAGLQVVEISDPLLPVQVDGFPFFYNGKLVDTDGNQFNDLDSNGNPVLDENGNPVQVNNPCNAQGVFMANISGQNHVFVAEGNLPDSVAVMNAKGIEVGDGVTLVDAVPGLKIINFTVVDDPTVVANYNTGITGAYSVAVDAGTSTGYLADFQTGISILDVSTPAAPTLTTAISELPASADNFYLHKETNTDDTNLYAYSLDSEGTEEGMRILKFAIVNNVPNSEFDNISLQSFTATPGEARDVFVGELPKPPGEDDSFIPDVYAFVADGTQGLRIYKVNSGPEDTSSNHKQNPYWVNTTELLTSAKASYTQGFISDARSVHTADTSLTWLFVADGAGFLHIVRFRERGAASNQILFDPNDDTVKSIPIIDPTEGPDAPTTVVPEERRGGGTVTIPGTPKHLIHSGNFVFIAAGNQGLQVVRVIDPNVNPNEIMDNPIIVGSVDTPGDARHIDLYGQYVFLSDGPGGLQIIDITSPTSPTIVGSFDLNDANAAWTFAPINDANHQLNPDNLTYAYVADGNSGIRVIDVTNPAAPTEETAWADDTVGYASNIAVNDPGSRGVVADGRGGLTVLAFTDTDEINTATDTTTEAPSASGCFLSTATGVFPTTFLFMPLMAVFGMFWIRKKAK